VNILSLFQKGEMDSRSFNTGENHLPSKPQADRSRASATATSLLHQLRTGDADGWRRLTHLYGSLVYSWRRQQSLQAEDAADVVQEVFRSVAGHVARFESDGECAGFRRWLKTITNNQIRDHWRRQKHRPRAVGGTEAQMQLAAHPQAEPPSQTSIADDQAEISHVMRQALDLVRADFEPHTWRAFWETVVEGRAAADVAADLGVTANAVRIAKSRVRSRLRQEFGKFVEE
jgi:RNA polymerase sigma-70 factor, ECF subfamily